MSLKLSDIIPASTLRALIEEQLDLEQIVREIAETPVNLVIDLTSETAERLPCGVEGCEETFENAAGRGGHRRHVHGLQGGSVIS